MRITVWGTRGTVATANPACTKYGGNTPCLAVEAADGSLLILDGGTGLPGLGQSLLEKDFGQGRGRAHLLVSHLHWDHIQGIPFFGPVLIAGNHITLYGAGSAGLTFDQAMRAQVESTYCPVPNFFDDAFGATVEIREIGEGDFELGPIQVRALLVNHESGQTCLGFRLEEGRSALAYLPNIEYLDQGHRQRALELARGADLLVHDAHYTGAEYPQVRSLGHASDRDAVEIARRAGVEQLLLFHHHPDRDDEAIDAVVAAYGDLDCRVEGAREGAEYLLE